MDSPVAKYFEQLVVPRIRSRHPELVGEMIIQVAGSVGLGDRR